MVVAVIFDSCLFGLAVLIEASGRTDDAIIVKQIDELLSRIYKRNEPGAAVIAVKEGKVIFRICQFDKIRTFLLNALLYY